MNVPVYLDYHATTPVDPRVVDAMVPYFHEHFGNAASRHHAYGWRAEAAVERAREQIARLINAEKTEIVLTSGATESINLAIKGVAAASRSRGTRVVTVATEHKAVLDCCKTLERYGFSVHVLSVDPTGMVDPQAVEEALTPETILLSVMTANNEIGTIPRLAELGRICRERGIVFHTDAAQAVGKIPVDVRSMHVDLLSASAHKLYGPKGVGMLYVRSQTPKLNLVAQMDGGGHERGFRSGTLNVPGIVGFGAAAEIAGQEMPKESERLRALRDRLEREVTSRLEDTHVNGHPVHRLPHNTNITFRGVRADRLMMDMKDLAVSSGSACSSASPEPSHVLAALGLNRDDVLSSIRFGLGRWTTEEEIDFAINRVVETVEAARRATHSVHA